MEHTSHQTLSIGGVSARTGCKVETIRYYEKAGLLPAPPRTAGGHRVYGGEHAQRQVHGTVAGAIANGLQQVRFAGCTGAVQPAAVSTPTLGDLSQRSDQRVIACAQETREDGVIRQAQWQDQLAHCRSISMRASGCSFR